MSTQPNSQSPFGSPQSVIADRIKRYKAGRVIEFLSGCPEFEELQENNFLEMNFADLAEFFVMQLGWESLEAAYEHYVFGEPYGLATLNAEFERLRLAAIAGGKEGHDAILAHLAAFKTLDLKIGLMFPAPTTE
jgi:hypothetical protein